MAEIRKAKSTDLGSRSTPDKSNDSDQRVALKLSTDERRSASPSQIGSSRRAAESAQKDKKPSSSSKQRSKRDNTLSPTISSKSRDKDRDREREKEKSSRSRVSKIPDARLISTLAPDLNDIETSEDIDIDDIDAEFKFDAEDDEAEENVFTVVSNPFLGYFESGLYADCTLVYPDGSTQRAHRLILSYCSRWFYNELMRLDAEAADIASSVPTSAVLAQLDNSGDRAVLNRHRSNSIATSSDSDASSDADEMSDQGSVPPSPRGGAVESLSSSTTSAAPSSVSPLIEDATITLPYVDDMKLFPSVLRWMYTGQLSLTPQNCVVLSVIAEQYQIPLLQRNCRAYISANLQRENALDILLEAIKFKTQNVISRSVSIVARNFPHLKSEKFRSLSFDIFIRVLQHRKLAVATGEFPLFKVVCEYVLSHRDLSDSQIYALMSNVRFRLMSFEELEEVSKNSLVPRGLIVEAAMYRLMAFECSAEDFEKKTRDLPARLQPRPKLSLAFDYNKDSTELFHGIIGWISTKDGTEEWRNPHIAGRVKVHSSSIAKGSRHILVDKNPNQVWTSDVPSSWFSIDFGPHRRISPTYYSLRHGGNYKGDTLRTWDLQGSVDGVSWKTIKRHQNDKALTGPFSIASWPVDSGKDSFRFFRILQTSHNSSGHNFLVLSGLEFFGRLDTA